VAFAVRPVHRGPASSARTGGIATNPITSCRSSTDPIASREKRLLSMPGRVFGTHTVCLTHSHAPYTIDREARDQWVECMTQAMEEAGIPLRYREVLVPAFSGMAEMVRNTG
jgi:Bacterial-like globin